MNGTIETIFWLVMVLFLLGTVIWAFQRYIASKIPEPLGWVGGVIMFLLILGVCFLIYDNFVAHHIVGHYRTRY